MRTVFIDLKKNIETITNVHGTHHYPIKEIIETHNIIFYQRAFVNHPLITWKKSYILSNQFFMFTKYSVAPDPQVDSLYNDCKYYIDVIDTKRRSNIIQIHDLFLDVVELSDGNHQVLDIDELIENMENGFLPKSKIIIALKGLNNILKTVYKYNFNLELFEEHLSSIHHHRLP